MKLTELDPKFVKILDEKTRQIEGVPMNEADGIQFLCPKCFAKNGGPRGTHSVLCWKPHVDPNLNPKPGRWDWRGTGMDDITLFAGNSSILLKSGCQWHGFIENGIVREV